MNSTLCALSSVAHLSISMTMLLSNRRTRRAPGTAETATGSGSDDTGPTPPTSNFVHSDDELRRAAPVPRRPPPKRRAASSWRSALYGLRAFAKPDAPSHIKSLPNLILSIDDVEQGGGFASAGVRSSCKLPSGGGGMRPTRRKGTPSGSVGRRRGRRDQVPGRDGDSGEGSAANGGLVTSDEEESGESSSSHDDEDLDNDGSTEELVLLEDDGPRRPPRHRRPPTKPVHTLASPRPTPQASPINSTGVTIVIDRTNSDDVEPTVVLGSTSAESGTPTPRHDDSSAASAEAVAALHMPHSMSTGADLTEMCQSPTSVTPNSNSQVFLLDDMA